MITQPMDRYVQNLRDEISAAVAMMSKQQLLSYGYSFARYLESTGHIKSYSKVKIAAIILDRDNDMVRQAGP